MINPFSGIGLPRKDLVFWSDRHELKERLMDFLKSTDNPNVKTLLLLGEYGSGKTHALLFSKITCDQLDPPIPAVYISSPSGSFSELYRKIIETLGFDQIVLTFDTLISRSREKILSAIEKESKEREELRRVESLSTERIIQHSFPNIDSDLAIVLSQVYNDRNLDLCRAWLLGRDLTKTEMSRLNVSKSVTSDEATVKILGDVLKLIIASRQQVILLIDEFEDVGNLAKTNLINYLKAFRKFIDQNIAGLKIIVAWTFTSYQQFLGEQGVFRGKTYEALTDRLRYNVENLEPMRGKDLENFISDSISRVYNKGFTELIDPKAIRFLELQIDTYPRQLNIVLNRAFQLAIEKNLFPIDVKLVIEALRQSGVPSKPSSKVA
jgi:hypothetical protein